MQLSLPRVAWGCDCGFRTYLCLCRAWFCRGCSVLAAPPHITWAGVHALPVPLLSLCWGCSLFSGLLVVPQLCPHRSHVPSLVWEVSSGCEAPCGLWTHGLCRLWEGNGLCASVWGAGLGVGPRHYVMTRLVLVTLGILAVDSPMLSDTGSSGSAFAGGNVLTCTALPL